MADLVFSILKARWKVFTDAGPYQSVEMGKLFNPSPRVLHFRTHYLPAQPISLVISTGFKGRYHGVFQVSVYSPEGNREQESRDLASNVEAHFYPIPWLVSGAVTVRIERPPYVKSSREDEGYIVTPVDVYWFADILA